MAIDKLSLFSNMPALQQTSAVSAGKTFGGNSVSSGPSTSNSSSNPFASNYVGINQNIGVGDVSYAPAQCGKAEATCRTLGIG